MSIFGRMYVRNPMRGFLLIFWLYFICVPKNSISGNRIEIKQKRFTSVRFDPSYYYNTNLEVKELCRGLAELWRENGINTVYVKVYDPVYGAVYRTNYSLNIQTDYGRLDLLKTMLNSCHKEDIRVYAWIPAFQHKHAWQTHSDWRVKKSDGTDYKPSSDSYFLNAGNSQFRKWWIGFIDDLLKHYKDIDGVDIAEAIVEHGKKEKDIFNIERTTPLTSLLENTCHLIHFYKKSVSVTTIVTSHKDGSLYSPEEQKNLTGFDLDGVLDSPDKPDILNVELLWQQWADLFQDTSTFSPQWTGKAVSQIYSQIKDRAKLVVHVELTPVGSVSVTGKQFLESIKSALDAGAEGIDFYDSYQADKQGLWPQIRKVISYIPVKKVVVYFDQDDENDARQLEVLLRHFNTETTLIPLSKNFSEQEDVKADVIFYIGADYRESLPRKFVSYLSHTTKTVCWINYNLEYLGEKNLYRLGLQYKGEDNKFQYQILYKGMTFPKTDSSLNIINISNPKECRVVATAKSREGDFPYCVKSDNFWYFADIPTSYVVEGGRHIVFADLLHDILREDHVENHLALVRIEDVNPESDPEEIKSVADFLASKNIPFSVGLVPFYLDPATNTALSLSDKPELVKALHYIVSKGGTFVLHGCTHQYHGQTTVDYEFWDGLTGKPIFEDSKKYVRDRVEKALNECSKNGIYPLVWETPHYAATLLDYSVINQFFTTSYERRQTMDVLGTDQLFPFFIPSRNGGPQFIPENLGYIPLSDPSPDKVVECARRNLALRDGFASFFFHPFVSLDVLKELVKRIQKLGYSFADIRSLNNRVVTNSQVVASGEDEVELNLQNQYLSEFYLTPKGKVKNHSISKERLSDKITRKVVCPSDWLYVARSVDKKERGFPSSIWDSVAKSPLRLSPFWQAKMLKGANPPVIPVILIDPEARGKLAVDQASFLNAFESVGIDYQKIQVSDFLEVPEKSNLIVVPYAAGKKLSEQQALFILRALSKGMNLIIERESSLSKKVGIEIVGDIKKVSTVQDEYYPQVGIHWKEEGNYRNFKVPIEYVTYFSEKNSGDPLIIGGEYGQGKYLYLATLFDPTTSKGYGRYPYFCDLIQREFGLWPTVKRDCAEIYFEPGDREDVSIEELVKMWKKNGFRKIYVAGWHIYPTWTYNYKRLIKLAHENAMLVYLWLELPHVSEKFWDDHPEWRERTATGDEAMVDWRHLMALTDKSCLKAVFSELSSLIQKYNWDGINLAELYFESPLGPERPDIFTPMHRSVRIAFQSQYGFDPIKLFDKSSPYFWKQNPVKWRLFEKFREDLIVQLHKEILGFLHQQTEKKRRNVEIVVTALDNIYARKTGENTAFDTKRIIGLEKEQPFTLQIEDPQELWYLGPSRYDSLSQAYQKLLPEKPLILDINVVPFRSFKKSLAPTRQPTGIELYNFIRSALQQRNRVALYSESSIYMVDLPWIAYALGRNAKEVFSPYKWEIISKNTVTLDLNSEEHKDILVDGQLWPAYYKGRTILPAGRHVIQSISQRESLANKLKTTARLIDISGELKSCRVLSQGIEVSYNSPVRNYIIINKKPKKVFIDRKLFKAEILHGIPGFSLSLPSGLHTVKIFTGREGWLSLKNFSIVISILIVLLSGTAVGVFVVLYVTGFRRRHSGKKVNPE